jgi:hypothetical protein
LILLVLHCIISHQPTNQRQADNQSISHQPTNQTG